MRNIIPDTANKLFEEVENVITPLARVVKLGIATDEERSRLEIWDICSVMVNGVDIPPDWSETPIIRRMQYRSVGSNVIVIYD
ncbi:TPA: tail fiber assembly protein [Salmonella enterica subsp. houtenae]|nr:tail fiber assembly protein [Salmonella enterica subsp. houtenae]